MRGILTFEGVDWMIVHMTIEHGIHMIGTVIVLLKGMVDHTTIENTMDADCCQIVSHTNGSTMIGLHFFPMEHARIQAYMWLIFDLLKGMYAAIVDWRNCCTLVMTTRYDSFLRHGCF